jgi:Ca2+ transporting ATPase
LYKSVEKEWGPSRHFSNVFNVFVWMQIFNMLNARKINDEVNIFNGIFSNKLYLVVMVVIFTGQIIIMVFGGYAMKVSLEPISGEHWGIAFAFAFGQLLSDLILKFVPDQICPEFGKK